MNGQTNRETNTETINQRYCKEGEKTNKLTVIKKEIQAYLVLTHSQAYLQSHKHANAAFHKLTNANIQSTKHINW